VRKVLETERLYLREFVHDDAEMIFRLNTDPDVMRFMPKERRTTMDDARRYVERFRRYYGEHPGLGLWPTILKADGACIGWTCLKHLDHTEEIEIGYRYFPPYWGRGLCTEISSALVAHGFRTVGLDRIVGVTHPEHAASRRVLEKLGLRYERDAFYYGTDVVYYALDRSTWEATQPPPLT
jgi:ribosomal-protein-alanine N-acetyltransferase